MVSSGSFPNASRGFFFFQKLTLMNALSFLVGEGMLV